MSKTNIGYDIKSIVNYLRKSRQDVEREKRTGEDTLHEQKQLMNRVLSDYEIPYKQEFEVGSGDKISTRPVFQQVIKDLENEVYDAIAVKEISRMGRGSYSDMGIIYDLIVEKRIYIITPWKIYDPTNPSDLRQIRFELFMSREEFETTRERLTGGRYNAAMEGKWVAGPPPFGFNYDKKTGKLTINEKEAKTVRTLFDFYANGIIDKNGNRQLVQFRALGSYLRRIGIKTITGKRDWSPSYLKYLLTNERYIGTLRFNVYRETSERKRIKNPENEHVIVENAHPAIIDKKLWDKTQERINSRDVPTNTKLDFEPNRLAGICVCKKCGKRFIRRGGVQRYKKKDGSISVYEKFMLFCGTNGCTYVRYNAIEDDIIETLRYLGELDEKTFKNMVKQIAIEDKPKSRPEDIRSYVQSKREELQNRMEFIYEKLETGIYTDDMFLERKKVIDQELHDLNQINLDEIDNKQNKDYNVKQTQTNIKSILETYEMSKSSTEKNKLLHSIFDHINIEIIEKGSGARPSVHRLEPYLKSSFLVIDS